ncbi:MAG TPA: serine/threonine-protein kinase, partial [Pirellulales bacterium]
MSQATDQSTAVNASLVWEQLSVHIDAFVTAWQDAQAPPTLADFVPLTPPALRRLTLVETIKVDLEYRWQGRRWPKTIEEYVAEFPELSDDGLPCDIIYEEYHIRKQHGDQVGLSEYCRRFPSRADELQRLLQIDAPTQSTALLSAEKMPTFEAGQQVDDFELISALGKGAFATVFRARQRSMQRTVALKISRDRSLEPQTLAQLEHPHIVRVFDQRLMPESKLRLLYMQYVPGGTLQGVIEHGRTLPPNERTGRALLAGVDRNLVHNGEEPPLDSLTRYRLQGANWPEVVCWMGARLAAALGHAHGHGILHRDIKPANVLLAADGQPKLADFNISFSKLDGATPAAYFGGTLAYMSPEQLEAYDPAHERLPDELDARADVFSLGVLLWELLTLRRPFEDTALTKDWSQALKGMTALRRAGISPEVKAAAAANCPAIILDVLLKALSPDPDDRHASAGELARDLELCLQPRAHALLHSRARSGSLLKRHPVAATLSIGLLPNVVMCIVNIVYNWAEIVDKLGPEDQRVFQGEILGVNLIAYSIGLGYVCVTRGPVFMALARLAGGKKVDPPPSIEMARRSLTLGRATAVITAVLWSISGFVVPGWIYFGAGDTTQLTGWDF